MSDVNWDDVPRPQDDAPPPKSGWLGTIAFVLFLIVGLTAGGAYVNSVMLGERVRELVVKECQDPTCIADARLAHPGCFSANVTYAAPAGLADFQTKSPSPTLGIGTVDLDAYRLCVRPPRAKTLADESP